MNIKHDYSYINNMRLVEEGYAELTVYAIHFDRYYTKFQQDNNLQLSKNMTNDEWMVHCDNVSKSLFDKLKIIVGIIDKKYKLYQYNEEVKYQSDWDLFFYSNKGWNNKNYYDYIKFSFNEKRSVKSNNNLLKEILDIVEKLDIDKVGCRCQYGIKINEQKLINESHYICKTLLNKFIEYKGMLGKIKEIKQDGIITYGFFKKGAKKKYYLIDNSYIVLELKKLI
jgi:hypothetical protein